MQHAVHPQSVARGQESGDQGVTPMAAGGQCQTTTVTGLRSIAPWLLGSVSHPSGAAGVPNTLPQAKPLAVGTSGESPCVTFRLVVAPLRGPGRSPVLPFACCVGSLLSVGRCGRCSCSPPPRRSPKAEGARRPMWTSPQSFIEP